MEKKRIWVWLFFLCGVLSAGAQLVTDTTVIVQSDTVEMVADKQQQSQIARQRVDSVITATSSDAFFAPSYLFKPSPRKAVLYSAVFPGLGQVYNRKYWKLPIIYGGFVGFAYAISWNNGYYRDYLIAYQDIMDDNPDTNSWHNMLPYGRDPSSVDVTWFTGVIKDRKDNYRYYRDFSIILSVVWYALGIVDAYVDAQLFDFDMSPDLSMRVAPVTIRETRANYFGNSYGLGLSFSF